MGSKIRVSKTIMVSTIRFNNLNIILILISQLLNVQYF